MGILSLGITPKEAYSEISTDYSAVIVTEPDRLPDAADFIGRLRKYASCIPIISVSDEELSEDTRSVFDLTLNESIYSTTLVKAISEHLIKRGKRAIGSYSISGIDAGCELKNPTYFGDEIALTKTESMILKYLIRIYPRKAKPREILVHAFKSGRCPEAASVRTHISVMNKKFREKFGHSLISASEGGGYTVLTPEYIEKEKRQHLYI
jgi:DNA-binding response OmpR family regulator